MIRGRLFFAILFVAGTIVPAAAACPAPMAGDTAAAVAANQQRLVCLQNEVARKAEQYQYKVEINAIQRSIDDIQLQRRFDSLNLPRPAAPVF